MFEVVVLGFLAGAAAGALITRFVLRGKPEEMRPGWHSPEDWKEIMLRVRNLETDLKGEREDRARFERKAAQLQRDLDRLRAPIDAAARNRLRDTRDSSQCPPPKAPKHQPKGSHHPPRPRWR